MTSLPEKVRVDYRGLSCHGKTLEVLGGRDFLGIRCLIVDDGGTRLLLPASRLIVIPSETAISGVALS